MTELYFQVDKSSLQLFIFIKKWYPCTWSQGFLLLNELKIDGYLCFAH